MANASDTYTGNAPDAYGAQISFAKRTKQVDITAWDNDLEFSASYNGEESHFEGDIKVPAGVTLPTALTCEAVKVRNRVAGQVARYQIVAWYIVSEYA